MTAVATVARSPDEANATAVTLGGLPAAAPWTTNRTSLNLPANRTQTLSQADGAQVYVQQVGDRYNVVVQGAVE